MKRNKISSRYIFQEIGKVRWTNNHSFEVRTKFAARLFLSPNTDSDSGLPTQVIIDEIFIPKRLRRRGNASIAMTALCQLADKHKFRLEGGPIGFCETLWRDKFVEWVLSFGFEPDLSPSLPRTNDPKVFYMRRLPRQRPVTNFPIARAEPPLGNENLVNNHLCR